MASEIVTPAYQINLTVWLSIITICLAAMATFTKIFSKKQKPEELPGTSPFCKQHAKDMDKIEKTLKDDEEKTGELVKVTNQLEKEVAILKMETETSTKSLDELKQTNRDVAKRLDELLRQLSDFVSN